MVNRLANEKSPYLLQHANNPVDWFPWGDEALLKAKDENKPILVSIGYSACHWCHVMERESFEDAATADVMNGSFVNVKVDREERPDIDAIYMEAVQALTGHGGWPLNVFLLPDGRPFYGGTYFPPEPRSGMPSWTQVLEGVASNYMSRREDIVHNASVLTEYIQRSNALPTSDALISVDLLKNAFGAVGAHFDGRNGGFGAAPKFPQPLSLGFVLRMAHRFRSSEALEFVELSLTRMADGGIHDQVGGGFHRYSVDSAWVVPHFEKMLYDNALLASLYVRAFQATKNPRYASTVEDTLQFLQRDLQSPDGGFYSALDADSDGVEGKYYVWTETEMKHVLDSVELSAMQIRYGLQPEGNFEGANILTVKTSYDEVARRLEVGSGEVKGILDTARDKLLRERSARVQPATDTKIVTAWNALAITAFSEAGRVLGQSKYLQVARDTATFLWTAMRPGGRLVRSYRYGPATIGGFLEDYAFFSEALITLYETSHDPVFLAYARQICDEMVEEFWDAEAGGFFDTSSNAPDLVVRPRSLFDNPIPSGNSAASFALLRLEALTGEGEFGKRALVALHTSQGFVSRAPMGFGYLLSAMDFYVGPRLQVAISGRPDDSRTRELADVVFAQYLPRAVIAIGEEGSVKLLEGRDQTSGLPTAYVCQDFACRMPITTKRSLMDQLAMP